MNDAKIIIIYKIAIIIPDKIYKKNFCHRMKFFGTYTHSASQLSWEALCGTFIKNLGC